MKLKRCPKCGKRKTLAEFYKNSSKKDGLSAWCKKCNIIYMHERYKKNPDMYRNLASKSYYKDHYKNKLKGLKQSHEYYQKHKNEISIKNKARYKKNRDIILKKHREYYLRNKEYCLTYGSIYQKQNKEKYRRSQNEWASRNREKCRQSSKTNNANQVRKLSPSYVRALLREKGIKDPEPWLIDATRQQIKLKRYFKNI